MTVQKSNEGKASAPHHGYSASSFSAPKDTLQAYCSQIKHIPFLSSDEEKALSAAYRKTGDLHAAGKLVSSHLRLVVKIALEYHHRWQMNLMDLIQEGNIGLLHAVKKFDASRNVKLSHYAAYWIRAYMLKFIMDNWRLVKIGRSRNQRKLFYNLQKEKTRLESMGYYAGSAQLAAALDTNEQDVIEMQQRFSERELLLDVQAGEETRETFGDCITDTGLHFDDTLVNNEFLQSFRYAVTEFTKSLDARDRYIVHNRILSEDPETLQSLGTRYGISKERVRQLEKRLKSRIHQYLEYAFSDYEGIPQFMADNHEPHMAAAV